MPLRFPLLCKNSLTSLWKIIAPIISNMLWEELIPLAVPQPLPYTQNWTGCTVSYGTNVELIKTNIRMCLGWPREGHICLFVSPGISLAIFHHKVTVWEWSQCKEESWALLQGENKLITCASWFMLSMKVTVIFDFFVYVYVYEKKKRFYFKPLR